MLQTLRLIWAEAMRPEDFRGQPYRAVVNQLLHATVGFTVSGLICALWSAVMGEMPIRGYVWIFVASAYYGIVEIWIQQFTKRDGLTDAAFIGIGAALPLAMFHEQSSPHICGSDRMITLGFDPLAAIFGVFVLFMALWIHAHRRAAM